MLIIEVNSTSQNHRVMVEAPNGESYEGKIIKGNLADAASFDLDMPFTLLTDDGEKVRVVNPWACHIETI